MQLKTVNILVQKPKIRVHLEERETGGRIILKWILEKQYVIFVGWIYVALHRDKWRFFFVYISNEQSVSTNNGEPLE
jgi:hypothetical protein